MPPALSVGQFLRKPTGVMEAPCLGNGHFWEGADLPVGKPVFPYGVADIVIALQGTAESCPHPAGQREDSGWRGLQ